MSMIAPKVVVSRSVRDVQPSDYLFKVKSFSILWETSTEKYETNDFEAGGYKWRLALYPNGNKEKDVKDHISFYLVIADTDSLPRGWEVNVNFKLFVFDHIHDKYLTIEDVGKVRRFHSMRTEWGFDNFISLSELKNVSNGYLVGDCCVFGAEVLVIKYEGKGECLSMKKQVSNNKYIWRVVNFSSLSKECETSDVFQIEGWSWKLQLYAKGITQSDNKSLSLFLEKAECEKLPVNWKVYAKYKLRIKDQVITNHHEHQASNWFCASRQQCGFPNFMLLRNLNDLTKDFILNNTIMVEVEFAILSVFNSFT